MIDDVIANIKSEFDEYGVSEEVLAELQSVSQFPRLREFVSLVTTEMGDESHSIPRS